MIKCKERLQLAKSVGAHEAESGPRDGGKTCKVSGWHGEGGGGIGNDFGGVSCL